MMVSLVARSEVTLGLIITGLAYSSRKSQSSHRSQLPIELSTDGRASAVITIRVDSEAVLMTLPGFPVYFRRRLTGSLTRLANQSTRRRNPCCDRLEPVSNSSLPALATATKARRAWSSRTG